MPRPKIVWTKIPRGQGMHGQCAELGDRSVCVVRCYFGEWDAYGRIKGRPCKPMADESHSVSYHAAVSRAVKFLRGELNPEVWP